MKERPSDETRKKTLWERLTGNLLARNCQPKGKRNLMVELLEPRILYSGAPAEAAPAAAAPAAALEPAHVAPAAPAPAPAPSPAPDQASSAAADVPAAAAAPPDEQAHAQEQAQAQAGPAAEASQEEIVTDSSTAVAAAEIGDDPNTQGGVVDGAAVPEEEASGLVAELETDQRLLTQSQVEALAEAAAPALDRESFRGTKRRLGQHRLPDRRPGPNHSWRDRRLRRHDRR